MIDWAEWHVKFADSFLKSAQHHILYDHKPCPCCQPVRPEDDIVPVEDGDAIDILTYLRRVIKGEKLGKRPLKDFQRLTGKEFKDDGGCTCTVVPAYALVKCEHCWEREKKNAVV